MTATSPKTLFASPLAVYCRSIAASMAGYWRFWRAANVPPFRNLRSDYPLFFTSCNCPRRHRCAHVHRLLMCNRIASSGARSKIARLVLALRRHRKNHALSPKHGLSSADLHKFASPDAGPISLHTERKQRSLTCASSPKLSVGVTLFAHECDLEDHRANVELPALKLQAESCFDKRNVKYSSLILAFLARELRGIVAQLIGGFHELNEGSCTREGGRHYRLASTQRRNTMSRSRGHLRFEPLFTTEELGLPEHANIAHVVKVLLTIGDGVAARWIEMPKCVLLLQTVAGIPESGAIYLYDRAQHQFYLAVFEQGREDALTTTEFEQLVAEYDLLGYIENRSNLRTLSPAADA
jgi:hypothetical protein